MSSQDTSSRAGAVLPAQPAAGASAKAQGAAPQQPARRWWPALPSTERQRVRWFVAGHVLAVWLLLQLALLFGDGHAPPPFPPDLSPAQRAQALALPQPARSTSDTGATVTVPADPAALRLAPEPARPLEWQQ